MRRYSRLDSVEERRNLKKTIWFVFLTIGVGVLLFFVGIPVLGKFVAFVSGLGKGNSPISQNDSTPPPPPRFDTFPEFTNSSSVKLNGSSEPGAKVKLRFNNDTLETLVDNNGDFEFSGISLRDGANNFTGVTEDPAGNLSQETKTYSITFDAKNPDLTIDSPSDGAQFFGSKDRQISITGTTEAGCSVTVNDRIVVVNDDGKFQLTTSLSDGQNTFTVKSFDQAGNTAEKGLSVNFSP